MRYSVSVTEALEAKRRECGKVLEKGDAKDQNDKTGLGLVKKKKKNNRDAAQEEDINEVLGLPLF